MRNTLGLQTSGLRPQQFGGYPATSLCMRLFRYKLGKLLPHCVAVAKQGVVAMTYGTPQIEEVTSNAISSIR